jgi:DNA-binding CsgD family transcriptional regulator
MEDWRRRAEMLDAALGVLDQQVYLLDTEGRNLYANFAAVLLTGLARSEIEGRTWPEIYPAGGASGEDQDPGVAGRAEVAATFQEQVRTTVATGRQTRAVYTMPVPYLRDFEVTLTPIFAPDGKSVDYIINVGREVSGATPSPASGPDDQMTARQRQIVELVARGLSYREIASELVISVRTVETHRRAIAERFGLKTRAQLFHHAQEQGWV